METLSAPHWNVITPQMQRLQLHIGEQPFAQRFHLASITDIGLMKCDALISRGSRKDFYDLFFIARHIPLDDLFRLGEKKYPLFRDFPLMVLESMLLFDNADRDAQPALYDDIAWEQVKRFFVDQARRLCETWFGTYR